MPDAKEWLILKQIRAENPSWIDTLSEALMVEEVKKAGGDKRRVDEVLKAMR